MKILVGAIGSLTIFLHGCAVFNFGDFPAKASRKESSVFAIARGGRVEITTPNGAIRIGRSQGSEVQIENITTCRARTLEEATDGLPMVVPEILSGMDILSLKVPDPHSSSRQWTVDLNVNVPPESSVVLKTANGEVTVNGIEGDIEATSANGKVTARDGGRRKVRLETSNGSVVAENLGGSIDARTTNGDVWVRGCPGKIDARSTNGAVEIDSAERASQDITARTSNGSVRCVLPGSFAGDLEAETTLGGVRCDFPVDTGASSKRSLRATLGAGGPRVRLRTDTGSIEVLRGST